MKEEKNHVGRPTNEEVAERKKEKLMKILAPVLVVAIVLTLGVLTLQKINTNTLKGAVAVRKNDLVIKSIQNDDFVVNNCNVSLKLTLQNTNKKVMIIDGVQIRGGKNKATTFASVKKSININGYSKNNPNVILLSNFSVGKFPTNSENNKSDTIEVAVFYHFSGDTKQYYNYDRYKYTNKLTDSNIKFCKGKETTTKKNNTTSILKGDFLTLGNISNDEFYVQNCNVAPVITVKKNKGKKSVIIERVDLNRVDGKILDSFITSNLTVGAGSGTTIHPIFKEQNFPLRSENSNDKNIRFTIIYHFSGETQKYYQAVSYAYTTKLVDSNITSCRKKATITAKKATTTAKKAQVTVKFYINTNSTTFVQKIYKEGEKGALPSEEDFAKNSYVRHLKDNGYYLAGWSLKKDATSINYSVKSVVSNQWIKNYNGKTVTLYAVWKKNTTTTKK